MKNAFLVLILINYFGNSLNYLTKKKDICYPIKFINKIYNYSRIHKSSNFFLLSGVEYQAILNEFSSYLLKYIFIKQLTNIGLKVSNFFRVDLIYKLHLNKLMKVVDNLSNKEIFLFN